MSAATQPADRSLAMKNVLVVQTFYVAMRDGSSYYEIHLAPDTERNAPRTILITRDEQAYELALAIEGLPARADVSWHHARRGDRRYCILDSLEVPAS